MITYTNHLRELWRKSTNYRQCSTILESTLFLNLIPGFLLGSWNQCIRVVRGFDDDKRDFNIVHVLTGGIQTLNYTCIVEFSTFLIEIRSMTKIAVSQLWTWQGGLFKSTCVFSGPDICFFVTFWERVERVERGPQAVAEMFLTSLEWTNLKMSHNISILEHFMSAYNKIFTCRQCVVTIQASLRRDRGLSGNIWHW